MVETLAPKNQKVSREEFPVVYPPFRKVAPSISTPKTFVEEFWDDERFWNDQNVWGS